jgi:hypothetical protein
MISAILGLDKNKGLTGTNKLLTPLDSLKPRIAEMISTISSISCFYRPTENCCQASASDIVREI